MSNKLEQLGKVQFTDSEEIKLVAKLFPYSLPLQALASRNLKENNKLEYDKFLRISSIISPDRTWLYNYVNNTEQKSLKITKSIDFDSINEKSPAKKIEISEIVKTEIPPVDIILEPETALISTNQEIADPLEESIIAESLKSSAVKPVENTDTDQKVKSIVTEKEQVVKDARPKITESVLEKEILKEAIDKSIQQEIDQINVFDDKPVEITEVRTTCEPEPEGFSFWLNPTRVKTQSREEKLKKIDALIEKFIKSEPKIVPKKAEFYSPVSVAKQSVEFDEDLVSEPLAAIFEKQGYFDKAIKAYEKLSLKYPEKRTYFATRIEKINEIIKNIKNNK
ncbi:MAG TPA: hypothetical protein VD905_02795 [Flavobacteriales bacterium]|nr:hypothetical protein [Flavobacteriales bacterium]